MIIESATYSETADGANTSINAVIDGELCFVPVKVGNRHYDEIMRQVDAGTLTIAEAE